MDYKAEQPGAVFTGDSGTSFGLFKTLREGSTWSTVSHMNHQTKHLSTDFK